MKLSCLQVPVSISVDRFVLLDGWRRRVRSFWISDLVLCHQWEAPLSRTPLAAAGGGGRHSCRREERDAWMDAAEGGLTGDVRDGARRAASWASRREKSLVLSVTAASTCSLASDREASSAICETRRFQFGGIVGGMGMEGSAKPR